jgi:hypothetical protein
MKLSPADSGAAQSATGRVREIAGQRLMELDVEAVKVRTRLLRNLDWMDFSPVAQKVDLLHATILDESALAKFGDQPLPKRLRRVAEFKGVPTSESAAESQRGDASYQKQGFDFLCHLSQLKLGGIFGGRYGSRENVADALVARGVAPAQRHEEQAGVGDLSGIGVAQLAARGETSSRRI